MKIRFTELRRLLIVSAPFISLLLMTTCSENKREKWSNYADLNSITSGMTKDDVEEKIGAADSVSADENIWYYGNTLNFVYFENSAVRGVSVDFTNGRIAEVWDKKPVNFDLKSDPSLPENISPKIPVIVNGKPVDTLELFQVHLGSDGKLLLTVSSSKKIFKMQALLSRDKIEDYSVMLDKPLLGGSGFSIFRGGFRLVVSSNEFVKQNKLTIEYEFNEKFGLGVTDKSTNTIFVSGVFTSTIEGDEVLLGSSKPEAPTAEVYKKTSFKSLDFSRQLDNCQLKLLEFTDLYDKQHLTGPYDTIAIARLLKDRGLSLVSYSHGVRKDKTRVTCISYADAKFDCGCHVDKLYYPTETEGEYIVTERINCYPNTWLSFMTSISHTD